MRLADIAKLLAPAVLLLIGCAGATSAEPISKRAIAAIPIGESRRVADLAISDFVRVCGLYPYQERLHAGARDGDRVNAYLSYIGYSADEGHWALVFISDDAIELVSFKRSEQLDILAEGELRSPKAPKLPPGFLPVDCAVRERTALSKVAFRDRIYVVLGEAE